MLAAHGESLDHGMLADAPPGSAETPNRSHHEFSRFAIITILSVVQLRS